MPAIGYVPPVIERTQYEDVTAFRLSWRRSQLVGYSVRVYVVRGAMIDTGFPGAERDVHAILQSMPISGALVTHHHEDHAGNVEMLARAGVPLAMDDATRALAQNPDAIGFYRHFTWRATRPLATYVGYFAEPSLELVSAPGHCDNHHVVWDASTGTLFSGDLFLGVKVRVAHAQENPRALVQSLRHMTSLLPQRMFCAHRGLVPHPTAALAAKSAWLENLIGETDILIDAGESDSAIARKLVGPRRWTDYFSVGDYSADNVIKSIRATRFG